MCGSGSDGATGKGSMLTKNYILRKYSLRTSSQTITFIIYELQCLGMLRAVRTAGGEA